ncbi:MAG: hypothetical protein ABIO24_11015, partial [Saprospiraceae bacterium]
LRDFENHINPATAAAADVLHQAGAVRKLQEVERHFWVASVHAEDGDFEVETIITPQKIKAFTCECWAEGRRLMCPHVAAALFKVRQYLDQKSEERKAPAAEKPGNPLSRLTVASVLNQASPEALAEFVQNYARRDRDFALALKIHFAANVTDAENPFALVLDTLLAPAGKVKTWREPDFKRLRIALEDLQPQLLAAAAESDFARNFQLASTILEKISPVAAKMDDAKRLQLIPSLQLALEHLVLLQAVSIAPDLQLAAWESGFQLAAGGYFPTELRPTLLSLLSQAVTDDARYERISQLFDQSPEPVDPFVLQLFTAALARRERPEAVVRVLEGQLENTQLLADTLLGLDQAGYAEAAYQAGDRLLMLVKFSHGQRRQLEEMMFQLAHKMGNRERMITWLWRRFQQTGDFEFYRQMKETAGKNWPGVRKSLLAELRKLGNTHTEAILLAAEGDIPALAELLNSATELEQIQEWEHLLLSGDKTFVERRYAELLSVYLNEHFGRQASAYVRQNLAGLLQKGENEMVLGIIRHLIDHFADRPTLPDELAELFPKTKRRAVIQPPVS